jgi:large subunit ribosomal protein L15
LRGFRNVLRVESAVVNVGRIQNWIDAGRLKGESPLTINVDVLEAAGLMKSRGKPLKVLGSGNLSAKLFVLADSFTESALTKIKAAGGSTQVLQVATVESALPVGVTAKKPAAKKKPVEKSEASAGADA